LPNIPFLWTDSQESYLIKIKNDTLFLAESEFAKFFNFAKNSDPFLVVPSQAQQAVAGGALKALKAHKKNYSPSSQAMNDKKCTVPLQTNLLKRIRACEQILLEEALQDESRNDDMS
jgi:hypothetical protein